MASQGYNTTFVTEFHLLSLSDLPELQIFLFVIFLAIYMTNVLGNIAIMVITSVDPHLHTPMYFFLRVLSFLDIFYSMVTVPKMFINFLAVNKGISYQGCITQLFFFHFLGTTEASLLAVMGYDRYIAIYNPLRYTVIMNKRICMQLVATVFVIGCMHSLVHTVMMARVTFCGPNQVNHFFCDIAPLLKLACSDTHINELLLFSVLGFIVLGCFILTLISYFLIMSAMVKMRSAEGRRKAFSTCASHMTVVSLHYGCAGIMYLRPKSKYSLQQDRVIAVLYTAVTPMLNPLIYTLRNKQVKTALRQVICGKSNVTPE
ncbi:olfactory receptor 12D2-like [Rhinatrema bivittatum]|uniref:olfactory receptor 12D2-like n=1 Tax=Rhinatrema bivittatum TaxID=194408 RepID=UPI0011261D14|nr:olfactory receptor 12D2-like [Rhinatrema bivittatum]XP_029471241.1 olfactory receptor 12D2-like [Rhinatrema bivittatum]